MKKAFIVTSAINVSNDYPLTYSATRTHFTAEERVRQTLFTVNSIVLTTDPKDTTIYVVDISENWGDYIGQFLHFPNVKFLAVAHDWPAIHKEVTTHPNKSRCEALILSTFVRHYKKELAEYDYIFKMSGRYYLDHTFDLSVLEQTPDKIFYKTHLEFDWNDWWHYELVDRRADQGDQKLYQYCSVIFAWGKKYQPYFLDFFTTLSYMLNQPSMHHYDIETLSYFFGQPFKEDIIETDWRVNGWDGTSGRYMRY
jgi:hypothetical protein